jgi:hypothetical protein
MSMIELSSEDQIGMVNSIMSELSKKIGEIYLIGLEKAGYDISDPIAIAKRCTLCSFEGSSVKELWVDFNKHNAKLVGYIDDTPDIGNGWEPKEKTYRFTHTIRCSWM